MINMIVMTTKKTGYFIKKYRLENNLNFSTVAERMSPPVHPTYISSAEKNQSKLTFERADQLSYILKMSEQDRLAFFEAVRDDRKKDEERKFDAEIERLKTQLNKYLDDKYSGKKSKSS